MSKNVKNLSFSEKVENEKKFSDSANIAEKIYNQLNSENDIFGNRLSNSLRSLTTNFSLNQLRNFDGTKEDFLRRIDSENSIVTEWNKKEILRYCRIALKHLDVSQTEKDLFLAYANKVAKATENFTFTFDEKVEGSDIVKLSPAGASGMKYTRFTVAGFRACFNSYETFRTELTRLANIQKAQKELLSFDNMVEKLLNEGKTYKEAVTIARQKFSCKVSAK